MEREVAKTTTLSTLRVSAMAGCRSQGKLLAGTTVIPCVLGPSGISRIKREGDGRTPAGRFRLEAVLHRADRAPRPISSLPGRALRHRDGWCDDPASCRYNEPVTLPFAPGHERLWRDDRLYDVLIVVDHNRAPASKRRGSAIFVHVFASATSPTAGCVALPPAALRRLLRRIGPKTRLHIV